MIKEVNITSQRRQMKSFINTINSSLNVTLLIPLISSSFKNCSVNSKVNVQWSLTYLYDATKYNRFISFHFTNINWFVEVIWIITPPELTLKEIWLKLSSFLNQLFISIWLCTMDILDSLNVSGSIK